MPGRRALRVLRNMSYNRRVAREAVPVVQAAHHHRRLQGSWNAWKRVFARRHRRRSAAQALSKFYGSYTLANALSQWRGATTVRRVRRESVTAVQGLRQNSLQRKFLQVWHHRVQRRNSLRAATDNLAHRQTQQLLGTILKRWQIAFQQVCHINSTRALDVHNRILYSRVRRIAYQWRAWTRWRVAMKQLQSNMVVRRHQFLQASAWNVWRDCSVYRQREHAAARAYAWRLSRSVFSEWRVAVQQKAALRGAVRDLRVRHDNAFNQSVLTEWRACAQYRRVIKKLGEVTASRAQQKVITSAFTVWATAAALARRIAARGAAVIATLRRGKARRHLTLWRAVTVARRASSAAARRVRVRRAFSMAGGAFGLWHLVYRYNASERHVANVARLRNVREAWNSWLYARERLAQFNALRMRSLQLQTVIAVAEAFGRWRVAVLGMADRRARVETAASHHGKSLLRATVRNWHVAAHKQRLLKGVLSMVSNRKMHTILGRFFQVWNYEATERYRIRYAMEKAANMHARNVVRKAASLWRQWARYHALIRHRVAITAQRFTQHTLGVSFGGWQAIFKKCSDEKGAAATIAARTRRKLLHDTMDFWKRTFAVKGFYKRISRQRRRRTMVAFVDTLRTNLLKHRATVSVQQMLNKHMVANAWSIWSYSMGVAADYYKRREQILFYTVKRLNHLKLRVYFSAAKEVTQWWGKMSALRRRVQRRELTEVLRDFKLLCAERKKTRLLAGRVTRRYNVFKQRVAFVGWLARQKLLQRAMRMRTRVQGARDRRLLTGTFDAWQHFINTIDAWRDLAVRVAVRSCHSAFGAWVDVVHDKKLDKALTAQVAKLEIRTKQQVALHAWLRLYRHRAGIRIFMENRAKRIALTVIEDWKAFKAARLIGKFEAAQRGQFFESVPGLKQKLMRCAMRVAYPEAGKAFRKWIEYTRYRIARKASYESVQMHYYWNLGNRAMRTLIAGIKRQQHHRAAMLWRDVNQKAVMFRQWKYFVHLNRERKDRKKRSRHFLITHSAARAMDGWHTLWLGRQALREAVSQLRARHWRQRLTRYLHALKVAVRMQRNLKIVYREVRERTKFRAVAVAFFSWEREQRERVKERKLIAQCKAMVVKFEQKSVWRVWKERAALRRAMKSAILLQRKRWVLKKAQYMFSFWAYWGQRHKLHRQVLQETSAARRDRVLRICMLHIAERAHANASVRAKARAATLHRVWRVFHAWQGRARNLHVKHKRRTDALWAMRQLQMRRRFLLWRYWSIANRELHKRIRLAFKRRHVPRCFDAWRAHIQHRIWRRQVIASGILRRQVSIKWQVVALLRRKCLLRRSERALVTVCREREAKRLLLVHTFGWNKAWRGRKTRRALLELMQRRSNSQMQNETWHVWRAIFLKQVGDRELAMSLVHRLRTFSVIRAFNRWREYVWEVQHAREVVGKVLQRWRNVAIMKALERWRDFVVLMHNTRLARTYYNRRVAIGALISWRQYAAKYHRLVGIARTLTKHRTRKEAIKRFRYWRTLALEARGYRLKIERVDRHLRLVRQSRALMTLRRTVFARVSCRTIYASFSQQHTAGIVRRIFQKWLSKQRRQLALRNATQALRLRRLRKILAHWRQRQLIGRAVARLMHMRYLNNAQLRRSAFQAWREYIRGIKPMQEALIRRAALASRSDSLKLRLHRRTLLRIWSKWFTATKRRTDRFDAVVRRHKLSVLRVGLRAFVECRRRRKQLRSKMATAAAHYQTRWKKTILRTLRYVAQRSNRVHSVGVVVQKRWVVSLLGDALRHWMALTRAETRVRAAQENRSARYAIKAFALWRRYAATEKKLRLTLMQRALRQWRLNVRTKLNQRFRESTASLKLRQGIEKRILHKWVGLLRQRQARRARQKVIGRDLAVVVGHRRLRQSLRKWREVYRVALLKQAEKDVTVAHRCWALRVMLRRWKSLALSLQADRKIAAFRKKYLLTWSVRNLRLAARGGRVERRVGLRVYRHVWGIWRAQFAILMRVRRTAKNIAQQRTRGVFMCWRRWILQRIRIRHLIKERNERTMRDTCIRWDRFIQSAQYERKAMAYAQQQQRLSLQNAALRMWRAALRHHKRLMQSMGQDAIRADQFRALTTGWRLWRAAMAGAMRRRQWREYQAEEHGKKRLTKVTLRMVRAWRHVVRQTRRADAYRLTRLRGLVRVATSRWARWSRRHIALRTTLQDSIVRFRERWEVRPFFLEWRARTRAANWERLSNDSDSIIVESRLKVKPTIPAVQKAPAAAAAAVQKPGKR
eukprot:TRINITY_DN9895_c0_g1_i1.p1 TRINITY_DN9895_c0_g1~~TRINITY_DN9895_c0_g1_i1.p1  ORF type:complete len:2257 (+),score=537.43 TRINITY_DN9895_c0_g1_i1:1239-8009(+)